MKNKDISWNYIILGLKNQDQIIDLLKCLNNLPLFEYHFILVQIKKLNFPSSIPKELIPLGLINFNPDQDLILKSLTLNQFESLYNQSSLKLEEAWEFATEESNKNSSYGFCIVEFKANFLNFLRFSI